MRADRSAVPAFQSTEPTTTEKALIRRVLLDICSVPLFGRVSMMFMLHGLVLRNILFRVARSTFFAPIGWGNGRHVSRHDGTPRVANKHADL